MSEVEKSAVSFFKPKVTCSFSCVLSVHIFLFESLATRIILYEIDRHLAEMAFGANPYLFSFR